MSQLLGCDRCKKTATGTITRDSRVVVGEDEKPRIEYGSAKIYVSDSEADKKAGYYDATKGWRFLKIPDKPGACEQADMLVCPECVASLSEWARIEATS